MQQIGSNVLPLSDILHNILQLKDDPEKLVFYFRWK
jgi:hypothetical protein